MTFRHIEEGRIESSFLAANGGGNVTGAQRIDAALNASTGRGGDASLLDRCVRTVLRRLGGLPEARGNRSVYVNCPLARAWWRERLVAEVATDGAEGLEREIRVGRAPGESAVLGGPSDLHRIPELRVRICGGAEHPDTNPSEGS